MSPEDNVQSSPQTAPPTSLTYLFAEKWACGGVLCGSGAVLHPFRQEKLDSNFHQMTSTPKLRSSDHAAVTFDAKLGVGISVLASVGQNYRHSEKFHFETSLPPIPYTSPTLFAPTCLANSCPMHPSGPGMVQRVLKGGQKRSV
eukprot:1158012-Pelagomonas_calceolata.AAC.4